MAKKQAFPLQKSNWQGLASGTLLSVEHDLYDREWPFSVPAWNASLRGASIKSSSKDAGTTRELDMESIREHSDGLEQNRQGADGLAPHNRQGHARCCFEAVLPEVPRARSGSGGFHEASTSRVIDCRGGRGCDRHRDSQAGGRFW